MLNDELPPEVILAIQRALEAHVGDVQGDSFDPPSLDTPFTPIPVLNDLFPDEQSLAHLDFVTAQLADTQQKLQAEIDSLQHELRQSQDPEKMQLIQEMISVNARYSSLISTDKNYSSQDLLGQMSLIREKATESEAVVRNITKDIQVLDTAKKNLILSMTTLKRLQMLGVCSCVNTCVVGSNANHCEVNALSQLEDLVKEKKYNEVSDTLAVVKQIFTTFKTYTGVPRISQVWKRIQEIQGELRSLIEADFDAFILQDTSKAIKPTQISDACLAVDVLGADFRAHLVDRYVALELKEYRRIFRSTDEAGQLDNLSRRFAWFRRMLQTHEIEQGRVFPVEWKVGWCLLAKFVDITRDDLSMLLVKAGTSLTVKVLLENLQITTEFENSMAKKWATSVSFLLREDVLIASLKRAPSQPQSRRSGDTRYDVHELKHACKLINTADYCLSTASELEDKIREKINEEFKERVSFQAERDMFVSVVSAAIVIQLRELETACDAAFSSMARTTWTASGQVTGQSPYAGDLVSAVEQVMETVKPLVEQKKYLRNLFDKACSLILAKFTNAIVKSRPLKEIGAEQLLIDLQHVKSYLTKMPGESLVTTSYTRGLTKSTTRLEALLKVIVTPVDPPEGFILNYTLLIGDASFSNFQKILDLKGTPKGQQNALLDNFLTITSTKTDLDSTSFLSSLDMEPPGPGQLGGSLRQQAL
ncbi:hypothetical protein H0H93_013895 [Arthromyces matolae]|nr:hypothetical protein H0H93_013895 [Arthromyces matolae]